MADITFDDIQESIDNGLTLFAQCKELAVQSIDIDCFYSAQRYCDIAGVLIDAVQFLADNVSEARQYNWGAAYVEDRFAAAYSWERRYGGPEEGGWYYTHRKLLKLIFRPKKFQLEALRNDYKNDDISRYRDSGYEIDENCALRDIILETRRPHYE